MDSDTRSLASVSFAIAQPPLSEPIRFSAGTCTSVKNTSQKPASPKPPTMLRSGRFSMPGRSIGMMKYEMPVYFDVSGSVRAMRMPNFATIASEVQIF